jgi:hypothetical protein
LTFVNGINRLLPLADDLGDMLTVDVALTNLLDRLVGDLALCLDLLFGNDTTATLLVHPPLNIGEEQLPD